MSDYTISEGVIYDADGNILGVTVNGEAKVEAIQRADSVFKNNIVDPFVQGYAAGVTSDGELKVETHPAAGVNQSVVITDPVTPANKAAVDSSGRLTVVTSTPLPPGTTEWVQSKKDSTPGSGGTDTWDVLIPAGHELTLQTFETGAIVTGSGGFGGDSVLKWKCELYYQPNGNTSGQLLLAVVYLQGSSESQRSFDYTVTGDGTARFHMLVTNNSDATSESTSFLKGYYQ